MIGKWLLGLFLKNWVRAALVGGILALAGGIYAAGYKAAWRIAEAETLKATIASQQRDIDANRLQRQADQNAIAALEAQAAQFEVEYACLQELIANRPADAGRGLTQSELDLLLGRRPKDQHRSADNLPARPACIPAAGGGP